MKTLTSSRGELLEFGQILIETTLEVFASMIFIEITPEELSEPEPLAPEITSLIGLAGDLKGILAIQCPKEVALQISGAMLGMELTELDEDVKDALGEIANMVAGGVKDALLAIGKATELAIPTTVIGKSVRAGRISGATQTVVFFLTSAGRFGVELKYVLD